ncbi:MAG: PAS domain S-box protein, partial [Candidatus Kapaibacterium sp.]
MAVKSTITCDMEGVIETFNAGAEEVFGYSKEEVIGKKR